MSGQAPKVSYQQTYRKCGKAGCTVCTQGRGHGPYWYASWRDGKRTRTRYIGRTLPPDRQCQHQLSVRSLGTLTVQRPDGTRVAWTRRTRELFTMLLSSDRGRVHRDVAAEALWPDQSPHITHHNLHVTLSAVRRLLGDSSLIIMDGDSMVLTLPAEARDDVAFEQMARSALATDRYGDLVAALTHYTGDFLADDRYSDWTVPRRLRLSELRLQVALRAAGLARGQGNAQEAIVWLRDIVAVDPCHEAATRALMDLYAACDRRHDALRLYGQLTSALQRELGVAPTPTTCALYDRLTRGEPVS